PREVEVRKAALATEHDACLAEAIDGVNPDDLLRVFGQRKRHPAAAASGVEHAAGDRDAGAFQKRDDLGAPVVLEQRVVVLGSEPAVGVTGDEVVSNFAQNYGVAVYRGHRGA